MKRISCVLAAALLSLLLAACGGPAATPAASPSAAPVATPSAAPTVEPSAAPTPILASFTAQDLEGNEVTEALLSDCDVTMVNVWATFCSPCLQEMPDLGALNTAYADRSFQVVGIVSDVLNRDGSMSDAQIATAKELVASTGATYTHLLPTADLLPLLDQAYAVPMTFFVDKDGNLLGEPYVGAKTKDGWAAIIDGKLAEVAS